MTLERKNFYMEYTGAKRKRINFYLNLQRTGEVVMRLNCTKGDLG